MSAEQDRDNRAEEAQVAEAMNQPMGANIELVCRELFRRKMEMLIVGKGRELRRLRRHQRSQVSLPFPLPLSPIKTTPSNTHHSGSTSITSSIYHGIIRNGRLYQSLFSASY